MEVIIYVEVDEGVKRMKYKDMELSLLIGRLLAEQAR